MKRLVGILLLAVALMTMSSCTTAQLAYTSAVLDLTSDVLDIALWPYHRHPVPPPRHCWR